jgi:hypothetical protein
MGYPKEQEKATEKKGGGWLTFTWSYLLSIIDQKNICT